MENKIRNNKAFTLIELIVVVGIIGILVGIASPRFTGFTKDASVSAMLADTKVLEDAAMVHKIEEGEWPTDGIAKLSPELEAIISGETAKKISKSVKEKDIQNLKGKLSDYAIITSSGEYEGYVVHVKGVVGKKKGEKTISHYNPTIDSETSSGPQGDQENEGQPNKPEPPKDDTLPGEGTQVGEAVSGVKFFGEVSSDNLISGSELAMKVGIKEGTEIDDAGWLKFVDNGKTLFIAKKPFRSNISWNHIKENNAVYGDSTIKIGNDIYKVRLPQGSTIENPREKNMSIAGFRDGVNRFNDLSPGSEWNRLMLPIHEDSIDGSWDIRYENKSPSVGSEELKATIKHSLGSGKNNMYTNNDLHASTSSGDGNKSWVQELFGSGSSAVYRGGLAQDSSEGLAIAGIRKVDDVGYSRDIGWRPILELVPSN